MPLTAELGTFPAAPRSTVVLARPTTKTLPCRAMPPNRRTRRCPRRPVVLAGPKRDAQMPRRRLPRMTRLRESLRLRRDTPVPIESDGRCRAMTRRDMERETPARRAPQPPHPLHVPVTGTAVADAPRARWPPGHVTPANSADPSPIWRRPSRPRGTGLAKPPSQRATAGFPLPGTQGHPHTRVRILVPPTGDLPEWAEATRTRQRSAAGRHANEPCSPRPGRAAALHRTPGRSAARDSARTPGAPPPPRRSADQVRRHAPVARASRVGATIGHPCHAAPRQAGRSDVCASEPNGVPPPRAPIAARRQRGPMPSRTAQPTLWFTTDRPKRGPRRRGGLPRMHRNATATRTLTTNTTLALTPITRQGGR